MGAESLGSDPDLILSPTPSPTIVAALATLATLVFICWGKELLLSLKSAIAVAMLPGPTGTLA